MPDVFRPIFQQFTDHLPGRLQEMRAAWETGADTRAFGAAGPLHLQVHSLTGAAGTFGYAALGERARILEDALLELSARAQVTQADRDCIDAHFDALDWLAAQGSEAFPVHPAPGLLPLDPVHEPGQPPEHR